MEGWEKSQRKGENDREETGRGEVESLRWSSELNNNEKSRDVVQRWIAAFK